jgi:hypothetical protein
LQQYVVTLPPNSILAVVLGLVIVVIQYCVTRYMTTNGERQAQAKAVQAATVSSVPLTTKDTLKEAGKAGASAALEALGASLASRNPLAGLLVGAGADYISAGKFPPQPANFSEEISSNVEETGADDVPNEPVNNVTDENLAAFITKNLGDMPLQAKKEMAKLVVQHAPSSL